MTAASFRFHLFNSSLKSILSNCNYINLPFAIPNVHQEINYLLTKCGELYFQEIEDSDFDSKLKECIENSKVVLDITWEMINTGHWKDVDPNWRYAFTFGSLFKVLCLLLDEKANKFDIIKTCDIGLLMGAPLMQNILSKIAFHVSLLLMKEENIEFVDEAQTETKKLRSSIDKNLKFTLTVADNIDHLCFKNTFIRKSEPVKLVNGINQWPALYLWSVEYILNKAQFRTVPIEIGSKYTDESWTQKLMTVQDFVDKYIINKSAKTVLKIDLAVTCFMQQIATQKQSEIGYLAQHNLFDQIPELFEDIRIPSYITENYGNVDVDVSVYFGPSGTISPLHFDPKHNLLAQIIGKKYIRLYSKENTDYLYPRHNTWLSNTSQVDVENPDLESFPQFAEASYKECILCPGDVLYIPPGCWHYVRSLTISLSISFWWDISDDGSC